MEKIKYLSQGELKKLLEYVKKRNFRDFLILFLSYRHGLRASEVQKLKIENIDFERRKIFIHRLKHGFSGEHPLGDDEVRYLKKYLKGKDKEGVLFMSRNKKPISRFTLDKMFKKYCEEVGIPKDKRHFHTLRHSIAVHMIEAGIDVRIVQDFLGHRDIRSTTIYTHITNVARTEAYYSGLSSGRII